MMEQFEVGDRVVFKSGQDKKYGRVTSINSSLNKDYPIYVELDKPILDYFTFTKDGRFETSDSTPRLFKVTSIDKSINKPLPRKVLVRDEEGIIWSVKVLVAILEDQEYPFVTHPSLGGIYYGFRFMKEIDE